MRALLATCTELGVNFEQNKQQMPKGNPFYANTIHIAMILVISASVLCNTIEVRRNGYHASAQSYFFAKSSGNSREGINLDSTIENTLERFHSGQSINRV